MNRWRGNKLIYSTAFFLIALAIYAFSFFYAKVNLTDRGEYHASLYVIGQDTTCLRIATHVEHNQFVTHTYISSSGLSDVATFLSKGEFLDSSEQGVYTYKYEMTQLNNVNVIHPPKVGLYMSMIGRLGFAQEEKVHMLYHDNKISVFDMMRNNNVIMYAKHH